MHPAKIIIIMFVLLTVYLPVSVQAFWGMDGERQSGLNLETGYDANTVTTVTGHIVAQPAANDRRNVQFELENNGARVVVILGPQRYWNENGIALKAGDEVTVRGSKAQGTDGIVYILAQKLTGSSRKETVSLRSESGRPNWIGGGMGNGLGRMNNRPPQMHQQTPGRMGGGRMGR